MTDHALFHVDTNAQDNTGVAVPAGTEAGKPVQPDAPVAPFAPAPSKAPNPVIAPSGTPALPGEPVAPVQNPPVHPDTAEFEKKIGLNQPDEQTEKEQAELLDGQEDALKAEEDRLKKEAEAKGEKVDEKKLKEDAKKNVVDANASKSPKKDDGRSNIGKDVQPATQGSAEAGHAHGGSGPAHDVTGQPHNELPA